MPEELARGVFSLDKVEMGLGAWAWGDRMMWDYGHGYTDDDIAEAYKTSLKMGVNLVDTAEVYGSGRSESLLGQFLKDTDEQVFVATKFMPFPWRLPKSALSRALHNSLERIGLEKVNLYQVHWPFPPMRVEHWAEALAQVVKAGLAETVGVSNYSKSQMQRARATLAKHGIPLASNQVEYHLFDRRVEKNGLLDLCREMGVRLIAYSPLAKGMLTGKYTAETPPPGLRGRKYVSILKDLPALIGLMNEMGQSHGGKAPGQVALNWLICKGALPIPGAKTARQAGQNAGATGWRLTEAEVKALDAASDKFS